MIEHVKGDVVHQERIACVSLWQSCGCDERTRHVWSWTMSCTEVYNLPKLIFYNVAGAEVWSSTIRAELKKLEHIWCLNLWHKSIFFFLSCGINKKIFKKTFIEWFTYISSMIRFLISVLNIAVFCGSWSKKYQHVTNVISW